MGVREDAKKDEVCQKYLEICVDLNMDKVAANEAWSNYKLIRQNYSLEGDQLHWLACAFYVACRKATPSTVGQPDTLVEGNLVSLTRLLRSCNLSLIQFFSKAKKWADMTNLDQDFQKKIDRLERNFAVSMVIFKKYQPIFTDLFLDPAANESTSSVTNPHKKQKLMLCTPSRLFDFCWTLFVTAKGEFPEVSDDLVNSYHLLLACCDYVFGNALVTDRKDLLNPKFPGLPSNFLDKGFVPPKDPPCIIHHLCLRHEGLVIEAKSIKEYFWQKHIRKLISSQVLKSNLSTSDYGILEKENFDTNFKQLNNKYESYVLSVGDFDERIFLETYKHVRYSPVKSCADSKAPPKLARVLRIHIDQGDNRASEIGTPSKLVGPNEEQNFQEKLKAKKRELDLQQNEIVSKQLHPATPLTGRKYLKIKDSTITPVSSATQSAARLQAILVGRHPAPSEALLEIYNSCEKNPKDDIENEVERLSALFSQKYKWSTDSSSQNRIDFAAKRLETAKTLFYKLLQNIILSEQKKASYDHRIPLSQTIFIQTLFACCLEIVIYSYPSQRTFPWILDTLEIKPYHFYKVIEIIVRTEEQLSREIVKHLNTIEEQVLESLAWQSDSPLWDNIATASITTEFPNAVPSCEDVSLPGQLQLSDPSYNPQSNTNNTSSVTQSPVSERFQSPIIGSNYAKKKLFQDGSTPKSSQSLLQQQLQPSSPANQQSSKVVAMSIKLIEKGGKKYISMTPAPNQAAADSTPTVDTTPQVKEVKKAKRTGSLALFFRKFYHLASVRMQELCSQLNVSDFELHRKIWTCFEHSIVNHVDLMRDRHLDQLLMCAVYVICKIVGPERTFTDIMRCYRYQPQATSHVYRSVLLKKGPVSNRSSPVTDENNKSKDDPKTVEEERGDLIKFYNTVYVKVIQNFALKFSNRSAPNESLALSPLPFVKSHCMSPSRRLSEKHPVYIRSLDSKVLPASPSKPLSYCFSRSPAKDLKAINSMISVDSVNHGINKRLLADDNDVVSSAPKRSAPPVLARKLQDLIGDRLSQLKKD
nr:PREDICTED: retinoblastoma-like protein 1 isoform X1 [Bemisia tabaci]